MSAAVQASDAALDGHVRMGWVEFGRRKHVGTTEGCVAEGGKKELYFDQVTFFVFLLSCFLLYRPLGVRSLPP